jgi:hypothetical protein
VYIVRTRTHAHAHTHTHTHTHTDARTHTHTHAHAHARTRVAYVPTCHVCATPRSRMIDTGNFATWDEHLLSTNVVVALFLPDAEPPLTSAIRSAMSKLGAASCVDEAPLDGCQSFVTPRGNLLLLCFVALRGATDSTEVGAVPWHSRYNGSFEAAKSLKLPSFCGQGMAGVSALMYRSRRTAAPLLSALRDDLIPHHASHTSLCHVAWDHHVARTVLRALVHTGEYIVATKWYTWPMLRHPLLRRFDVRTARRHTERVSARGCAPGGWPPLSCVTFLCRAAADVRMCPCAVWKLLSASMQPSPFCVAAHVARGELVWSLLTLLGVLSVC